MASIPPPTQLCAAPPLPAARRRGLHVSTKGLTHCFKFRVNSRIGPRARLELGADLAVDDSGGAAAATGLLPSLSGSSSLEVCSMSPVASLCFQLDEHDRGLGCLRLDTHKLCASARLHLGAHSAWWSGWDVHAGIALADGKLMYGVKPAKWQLAVALGAAMLAAGLPVHIHNELGMLGLQVPIHPSGSAKQTHTLQERVEAEACLRRQGAALTIDVRQLGAVVRLHEV